MASVPLHLISLTILLHFIAAQQPNGSIPAGSSITASSRSKPWLSPSGEFAFGFQQVVQGKDEFLLSIWYDKIREKTIIWYPKGGPTVPRGSRLDLVNGNGLVLRDPQGKEVWSSGPVSDFAYGYMNDTGNFMLVGRSSNKIWESFANPADTMVPTQVMSLGGEINSKVGEVNFNRGKFQLRLLPDGNVVLNTVDMFSAPIPDAAYYISGTRDESNSTNSGFQLVLNATGYMYILRRSGERAIMTPIDQIPSGDYYHRATVDYDGVFTQYVYPKNSTGATSWKPIMFVPNDICTTAYSNACGVNSVCTLDANRPTCECPQGFSLLDLDAPNGDCKPDFTPSCDEGELKGEDEFDFIKLTNIDWPFGDYASMGPVDEQNCKVSCLKDCFCAVAIYRDNQCWKKQLPLRNGKKNLAQDVNAFLKFRKADGPPRTGDKGGSGDSKSRKSLIFVGSFLLSAAMLGNVLLISVIYMCFFRTHKKKDGNLVTGNPTVETNIGRYTYHELVKATDGFKHELGKGAFGVVYKGVIEAKIVAVKKLETVVQEGQKEFKAEVNTIARTHHKNLVQLLGYCDDGEHRLLIYEFMSNGTLAEFLFGARNPSWKQRSYIAVGIAKGLTYLHEDCSNQIIHCDIKPQNILLDDYYNAKISDFGLAKLLQINQSQTNTGIRGTKGYVAPEWFRNTPVTFKVDVYSYGVLLLEIISCRKSVVFDDDDGEDASVLTDLAWDCYQEGRMDAFVGNDLEALDDFEKLTTFMMVGLWCVQENPSLRPTMKKVIQMLEGGMEVSEPPCPFPFSATTVTST